MTIIVQYLFKLSISLAFVYLFYALVLRRLTFYSWNRWYLLGYSLLAFFIPFVNISSMLQKNEWTNNKVVQLIPSFENYSRAIEPVQTPVASSLLVNYWLIPFLLFIAGITVLAVRLLVQYLSYHRLRQTATLISSGDVKVYQVNKNIIPFSFGNAVFINQHQHTDAELEKIIRHEFIHVKQKHTTDILWGELLCMVNWYNPFAWLIRRAIRQNLEFIADNRVISEGADKKQYQYLLLKVVGVPGFSLSQQFNFSSLKKRIAMMNRVKSARLHLLRFMFILPLIAVLLVSFRNKIDRLLTVKTNPILLQQPPDLNKFSFRIQHPRNYFRDTTPSPKVSTISHPPVDSGSYIIDASQNKSSVYLGYKPVTVIHGGDPLIVIDGVMQNIGMNAISTMNPNDIQSISVYKDETAIGMYGDRGKNGVIIILTKAAAKQFKIETDTSRLGIRADSLFQNLNDFKGLIIIDDIEFSAQELMNMHLPPNSVEAIDIYKGEEAEKLYGKKATNGVIKIVTKAKAHTVTSAEESRAQNQ